MENLPMVIKAAFVMTTLLTVFIFYKAARQSKGTLLLLSACLIIQAALGISGFYTVTSGIPPRTALLGFPPFLFIIGMFVTRSGRNYIDNLDVKTLTLLHIVRVPVELLLFSLFLHKAVPKIMTFEGRNFDILSGLTAPFIYYFGFVKIRLWKNMILLWNFICLGLLINIVINAVFSAPTPFQQFAFDQPNVAILYFPFVWLPCCIVPLVFLSHFATIRQILYRNVKA